jgi:phage terminase large subunit
VIDELQRQIRTTNVFSRNAIAFANGKRFIVNQGGTSSSKTYSILQLLDYIVRTNDNISISVVSESMPHLKKGAMRDYFKIIQAAGLYNERDHNKTDCIYTVGTSFIEFFSADSHDKVRGMRRNILYINEANNIPFETYDQLAIRTFDAIFIDFNPVAEFWAHTELLNDPVASAKCEFIKSTYKDNRHLHPSIVEEIEARASNPKYENWFKVYGLGEVGSLEGAVFNNWSIVDALPEGGKRAIGIDFGFTNDPTALADVYISDGDLYLDEVCYQTGMLNGDIMSAIKSAGINYREKFVADSADPKSIADLKLRGLNIFPAIKGADSVITGINAMKEYNNIFVTRRSVNAIKEFRNYVWAKDKTGKSLNEPVDVWNHFIDASRYAEGHIGSRKKFGGARVL